MDCVVLDDFFAEAWKETEEFYGFRTRKHSVARLPGWNSMPDLDSLKQSEGSLEFDELCLNRMIMGAFRYGRLGAAGKPQYDRVEDARRRLALYAQTGNLEHLVAVANIVRLEFVEGKHPLRHMSSSDDGTHTNVK